MWKRLLIALVLLILVVGGVGLYLANEIYLRHDHQGVSADEFDEPLSPHEIRADVESLIATLEGIHPSFEAIGGVEFVKRAHQLVDAIPGPMTRVEAYCYLAPLNELIADGHTSLRVPAEERDAYVASGGRLLPFTVSVTSDGLEVDQLLADDLNLESGDRLNSINGVEASVLSGFSLASQSGESIALRGAYAQRFFSRDSWAFGIHSPFEIELTRDGSAIVLEHLGLTRKEYLTRRDQEPAARNSYRLIEPGVGLLTFNEMPPADGDFRRSLETTFAAIRQDGVESLIIDLRENGGGDSRAGDALMAYLADRDLPAIDYVDVKVTEEIKEYYLTLLPSGFRWIPLNRFVEVLSKIRTTQPGETFRMHPDAAEPTEWDSRPANAFDGELFALIGSRTYSSAVIFAAPLKHFGRATFVGEETGEPLIFFGENYYFDLPNSKLEAQVSHKKFALVGASDELTGIEPDYVTRNGRDALDVALDIIAGERAGGQGIATPRDVGDLLARFDALAAQFIFDPRLLRDPEWLAFRAEFEQAALQAKNDRELLAAFDDALATHRLFSHFELRFEADKATGSPAANPHSTPVILTFRDEQSGVLSITSFSGDSVMAEVNAALDQAIDAEIDTLFVDLRGNPGGTFAAWPLVSRLATEPVTAGYLVAGKWYLNHDDPPTPDQIAAAKPTTAADQQILIADLMDDGLLVLGVEPQAPSFVGEVVVLIDEGSASTSEVIAGALQFNDIATIVGETSAGEVLNAELFPLDTGIRLLLPIADFFLPDGTRLEGTGVIPDQLDSDNGL